MYLSPLTSFTPCWYSKLDGKSTTLPILGFTSISKLGKTYFELDTWLGKNKTVKAETKEDVYITLSKKDSRNFKVILDYSGPIKAPIKKDQEIGKLKVFNKDELIKEIPLYAAEDLKKINFFKSFFTSLNYMIWGDV